MTAELELKYSGKLQPDKTEQEKWRIFPYLPDDDLLEVVKLAIYLQRPLLIKGDPGSGKTRLAYAVWYEFTKNYQAYIPEPENDQEKVWPFQFWPIKSTSRARDGLYTYDAIGRLRDVHLASSLRELDADQAKKLQKTGIKDYIKLGQLGHAFESPLRTIVLIDEIDKADIDFPNDLLTELEDRFFVIPEWDNKKVEAKVPPIVFITSNDEKDLPGAFLRRCIFHYIKFPDKDDLIKIASCRFPDVTETVIAKATDRFFELREQMEKERGEMAGKRVSTSELLDLVNALSRDEEQAALKKLDGRLPFLGALLKDYNDQRAYLRPFEEADKAAKQQAAAAPADR